MVKVSSLAIADNDPLRSTVQSPATATVGDVNNSAHAGARARRFGSVQISQSTLVTGASAGATAYALVGMGLANRIPRVGGINSGIVLVALGFAVAIFVKPGGTLDNVAEGIGYGAIAVGSLHIVSGK